jgi:hypothetical protein
LAALTFNILFKYLYCKQLWLTTYSSDICLSGRPVTYSSNTCTAGSSDLQHTVQILVPQAALTYKDTIHIFVLHLQAVQTYRTGYRSQVVLHIPVLQAALYSAACISCKVKYAKKYIFALQTKLAYKIQFLDNYTQI